MSDYDTIRERVEERRAREEAIGGHYPPGDEAVAEALERYLAEPGDADDADAALVEQWCRDAVATTAARVTNLASSTTLSQREAEVAALKEEGLTHEAIGVVYRLLGGTAFTPEMGADPPGVGAIDTYSRRARAKYRQAELTVDELALLYAD